MTSATLLTVALVVFLGGFVQGAVGFAFSLIATPLLVLSGLPVVSSVLVVATSISIQSTTATVRLFRHVPWHDVLRAAAIRLIGLPLGLVSLLTLSRFGSDKIRMVLGGLVVATVIVLALRTRRPADHPLLGRRTGLLAFLASGYLQGLASMGGPPMALWAMNQGWDQIRTRAFMLAQMSISAPLQVALLLVASTGASSGVLYGVATSPLIVLGTLLGVELGNRMRPRHLYWTMMGVLLATGLSSLLAPLLS